MQDTLWSELLDLDVHEWADAGGRPWRRVARRLQSVSCAFSPMIVVTEALFFGFAFPLFSSSCTLLVFNGRGALQLDFFFFRSSFSSQLLYYW
jgi:hypothetical protein